MINRFGTTTTLALPLALALAFAPFGCTSAEQPSDGTSGSTAKAKTVSWKFAIEEIQGSVQDAYAQRFKELIQAKSAGQVKVTVYPYGSLGTSDQLTELVQNGAIQFAMASPGHLGKLIPETQVFLLHFLFDDDERANDAALASPALTSAFAPLYEEKQLKLLSLFPEGWMVWTTRTPVRKPSDFDGMKIRVMTSPLLLAAYEAYGANPTPMPYAEVYSGLQLGMIDGQVNPIFAIEEMSFHEVTDVLTIGKHAQFVTSAITSPAFWKTLDDDQRRWILEATDELRPYVFSVQEDLNATRLETIEKERPEMEIARLDEAERAAFQQASLPVRKQFVEMSGPSGKAILETLLAAVGEAASRTESAGRAADTTAEAPPAEPADISSE